MKKHTSKVIIFILIVLSSVDCQKWNSNNGKIVNGRRSSRTGSYYLDELNGGSSAEINQPPPVRGQALKTASTGGIGAWGYVSIILFVILSGMGIYYTIIFYPIVCKKQRMYHVMGHTTV